MKHGDTVPREITMTEHDTTPVPGEDTQTVRDLLAEHVPLALIVDLATPEATSTEILDSEGLPDETWWEQDQKSTDGSGA